MAKIFRKDNSLKKKYDAFYALTAMGGVLFAVGFFAIVSILVFAGYTVLRLISGFICLLSGIISVSFFGKTAHSLYIGLKGEAATSHIVEKLPEGYYGIQNAIITFEGKKSEIDMIVVGPTGVFIIESKSRKGRIVGNYDAKYWTQHKIGRGGTPYSSDFHSPVKQVGTHIYRLAHFLRATGTHVNIEGAVFMSESDSKFLLSGTPGRIPVFRNSPDDIHRLYSFITSRSTKLSPQNINHICETILNE